MELLAPRPSHSEASHATKRVEPETASVTEALLNEKRERDAAVVPDPTRIVGGGREERTGRSAHPTSEESSTLEEILAGKWLTWVGALAVIIGAGFGFKYAVDNGWLDPSRRVILGLIVGACSFAGENRQPDRGHHRLSESHNKSPEPGRSTFSAAQTGSLGIRPLIAAAANPDNEQAAPEAIWRCGR